MMHCKTLSLLFVLVVFTQAESSVFAQTKAYPYDEWVKKLSTDNGPVRSGIDDLFAAIKEKDSTEAFAIFKELEKRGNIKNNFFKARLFLTKANGLLQFRQGDTYETQDIEWVKQALNAAYETNNDSLISETAWTYGLVSYQYGRTEPAAMYCLFAAELDEKIGRRTDAYKCWYLGLLLYRTRDYRKALQYTQISIQRETDTSRARKRIIVSRYNTVALCYHKMGNYDSAFFYYDVAVKMAGELNDTLWKAIISGNKGQIYYLQKKYAVAKPLLFFDYSVSKVNKEENSAANTLQWIARISLAEGNKDSALIQVNEALHLIELKHDYSTDYYRQNIYAAATEVYRSLGNKDSTLKYSELYNNLHDSLERAIADSRLEMSRIKLENLQNVLAVKNLHKEKEAVAQQRNFIVAVIVMFGVVVVLILNRQRQKLKHKQQLALREKTIAETRMAAAETERLAAIEQMNLFTQNLVEKSNLIEKLEQQLQTNHSAQQEALIKEITNQAILTEEDWSKFKILFEKIHPRFFSQLKQKVNDITIAEQRMAALIRLQLQPKQISSLLGISLNSVYKTKQRLRHRFNLETDWHVEEFLTSL